MDISNISKAANHFNNDDEVIENIIKNVDELFEMWNSRVKENL